MKIGEELSKLVRLQDEITHMNEKGEEYHGQTKDLILTRNEMMGRIESYVKVLERVRDKALGIG
jgi:hypothetical protein